MKKLTRYFINGLLVLTPTLVTVYVIYAVFTRIEGLFGFKVPGLGIAATLSFIVLVGFAASNILTRRIVSAVESLFIRLPLLRMIYTAVRDLIGAFVGEKKGFSKPVTVAVTPDGEVRVLGFVTADGLDGIGLGGSVAVYLPQSYNFAGNVIIVPSGRVAPIEAEGSAVMAFIVSGGLSKIKTKAEPIL